MRSRRKQADGYWVVEFPEHPRADKLGDVFEHVLIAERALRRPLCREHPVHHVDRNPANNANANLVICQDDAYHMLRHKRQRALDACGNADWMLCPYCARYDDPIRMANHGPPADPPRQMAHTACRTASKRALRERRQMEMAS